MTYVRNALAGLTLAMLAAPAAAATINLEPPIGPFLGDTYTQDGFTFTNTPGPLTTSYDSATVYFNWKGIGGAQYDADLPGSTLDVNYFDTINTITKAGGGAFFFGGISLANIYNSPDGGNVIFTVSYASGLSSVETRTLAMRQGLQAFAFNLAGVTSVAIATDPTNPGNSHDLQFDYLVANSTAVGQVPLPASLPLFGAALLTLTGLGYGLKRRTSRDITVAATA